MSLVEKLVKIPSSFFVEKEPFLYLHASEGAVSNSVTNRVAGNGGRGAEKTILCSRFYGNGGRAACRQPLWYIPSELTTKLQHAFENL